MSRPPAGRYLDAPGFERVNIGKLIGDAFQRLPVIGRAVQRLRTTLRERRLEARQARDGGPRQRYARWVRDFDVPAVADDVLMRTRVNAIRSRPLISLIMVPDTPDVALLERAIRSIRSQVYPAWELCILPPSPSVVLQESLDRHANADARVRIVSQGLAASVAAIRNVALDHATGDFVAIVGASDVMPPQSLLEIAEAIDRERHAVLVYADEDRIDVAGCRSEPWFKCDHNRELLLTHDVISRPAVYPRGLVRTLGGWRDGFAGAEDYDLALRVAAGADPGSVVHVPHVLYHRGTQPDAAIASGRRAVAECVRRLGIAAEVEPAPEAPDCHRVRRQLPSAPPLVSIVICTRDHERLLQVAVDSILARTTYPRYEIIVVDNGSVEPRAVAYLAKLANRPGVTVLRDDSPFNYSRLNNRAMAVARGEVLCLLNDDIEVLTPHWLEEMVALAVEPDVGAVGARLWYPDGTLQHGGVIVGICAGAAHAHPRLGRGDPGYFRRAVLPQELSAVTAACLVVRAAVFAEVAGLDEVLEVAFNDVDLCLRIRQAGYRNVWTPYAELVHHESASRGHDDTPAKRARSEREIGLLRRRWGQTLLRDPFYNPNLSHVAADFSIDCPRHCRRAA